MNLLLTHSTSFCSSGSLVDDLVDAVCDGDSLLAPPVSGRRSPATSAAEAALGLPACAYFYVQRFVEPFGKIWLVFRGSRLTDSKITEHRSACHFDSGGLVHHFHVIREKRSFFEERRVDTELLETEIQKFAQQRFGSTHSYIESESGSECEDAFLSAYRTKRFCSTFEVQTQVPFDVEHLVWWQADDHGLVLNRLRNFHVPREKRRRLELFISRGSKLSDELKSVLEINKAIAAGEIS
jgi:hypothetical protein